MERLDSASVMTVLRGNINEDLCPNQLDLIEILFGNMGYSPESYIEFDNSRVCRCRILFTTRSRYEKRISPEARELPVDILIARLLSNGMLKLKALLKNCKWKRQLWMLTIRSAAPRMAEIKRPLTMTTFIRCSLCTGCPGKSRRLCAD